MTHHPLFPLLSLSLSTPLHLTTVRNCLCACERARAQAVESLVCACVCVRTPKAVLLRLPSSHLDYVRIICSFNEVKYGLLQKAM